MDQRDKRGRTTRKREYKKNNRSGYTTAGNPNRRFLEETRRECEATDTKITRVRKAVSAIIARKAISYDLQVLNSFIRDSKMSPDNTSLFRQLIKLARPHLIALPPSRIAFHLLQLASEKAKIFFSRSQENIIAAKKEHTEALSCADKDPTRIENALKDIENCEAGLKRIQNGIKEIKDTLQAIINADRITSQDQYEVLVESRETGILYDVDQQHKPNLVDWLIESLAFRPSLSTTASPTTTQITADSKEEKSSTIPTHHKRPHGETTSDIDNNNIEGNTAKRTRSIPNCSGSLSSPHGIFAERTATTTTSPSSSPKSR